MNAMQCRETYMNLSKYNLEERKILNRRMAIYKNLSQIAAIICFALICLFSLLPAKDIPSTSIFPFADKGAHAFAYTGFGLFIFLTKASAIFSKNIVDDESDVINWIFNPILHVYMLGLPLGIIIEFIQSKVGRSFDLLDWLADTIGLTFGIIVAIVIVKLVFSYRFTKVGEIEV